MAAVWMLARSILRHRWPPWRCSSASRAASPSPPWPARGGRRQLLAVVAWQATIVACFGIIVGLVGGALSGAGLWHAAATSIGVGTGATVPVVALLAVAVGAVAIANAVAALPARAAARTPAAVVLRTE